MTFTLATVALLFVSIWAKTTGLSVGDNPTARRAFLGTAAAAFFAGVPTIASAQDDVKWDVFNGLIFNYRGNKFNGLDASSLNEPSVPFLEFGERLKRGEVEFVEFVAPDGDAAYATFRSKDGGKEQPIRIGEGFPVEQHDGYSSPLFVVRALQNTGVPYKFTVPGLASYK